MDIVFSDIWQWLKDSLTVPGALAVVIVVFLIGVFIKHKLFKDSVEKDRATATEKKAKDTYNNKGTFTAPVVQDSTVGGDVVGGNKIVYQALPGSSILDEMEAKEKALKAKGKLPEHELTWTPVRRGEVQLVADLTRELGCGIEQAYKSEPFTRQYCGTRNMVFVIKSSERGRVTKRDIYGEDDEISFSESGMWPYYRLELEGDRVIEKTPHEVVTDYKEVTSDMQLAQELFERVKAKTGIAPSLINQQNN